MEEDLTECSAEKALLSGEEDEETLTECSVEEAVMSCDEDDETLTKCSIEEAPLSGDEDLSFDALAGWMAGPPCSQSSVVGDKGFDAGVVCGGSSFGYEMR